jgi:hypothetical protein
VSERDYGSFGALMDEHYVSDDTNVRLLARCILTAYARSVWRISSHRNRPTLRLLLLHDDAEREFDYRVGAEQALSQAEADGWTVVSIKSAWATVLAT